MRIAWLLLSLMMAWPAMAAVETGSLESLLQQGATYQADSPREPLAQIEALMRQLPKSPEVGAAYETCFLEALAQGGSLAWQDFLCRQLSLVGGDASVTPMVKRLQEPDTADMARFVLERLDSDQVNPALCAVLAEIKGDVRIGVVNTLGVRGDTEAVNILAPLLKDNSRELDEAVIAALGQIASDKAIGILTDALSTTDGTREQRLYQALLVAADKRARQGDQTNAIKVYQQVARSSYIPLRRAALVGQVEHGPQQSFPLLVVALGTPELKETAMQLVAQQRDAQLVRQLAGQLKSLPPESQIQLLHALAATGQSSCLTQVIALLARAEGPVRIAALQAVGALGQAKAVELLANIAAGTTEAEQEAARAALYGLQDPAVDERIVSLLPAMPSKIQLELVLAAEQRRIGAAAPALMSLAQESDRRLQRAALSALAEVAGPDELALLTGIVIEQKNRVALDTLVKAAQRLNQVEQVTSLLVEAGDAASDVAVQTLIFQGLGRLGSDQGLAIVQKATESQDEKLRTEAIRALAQWPTPAPQPILLSIARSPGQLTHRVLALRGYVDMAVIKGQDQPQAAVLDLVQAVAVAQRVEEKRYVLGALPRCACPAALTLAQDLEADAALQVEAQMAQVQISANLPSNQRDLARQTLTKIHQGSDNESVRQAAEQALSELER